MFDTTELDDIRDALYTKKQALEEHIHTLTEVRLNLEAGKRVVPFASGRVGISAADGMMADMATRLQRVNALIKKVEDKVYSEE